MGSPFVFQYEWYPDHPFKCKCRECSNYDRMNENYDYLLEQHEEVRLPRLNDSKFIRMKRRDRAITLKREKRKKKMLRKT